MKWNGTDTCATARRGQPPTLCAPVPSLVAALPPEDAGKRERRRRELREPFASRAPEDGGADPPPSAAPPLHLLVRIASAK